MLVFFLFSFLNYFKDSLKTGLLEQLQRCGTRSQFLTHAQ